jgi:phosphoribosylformylglycinamidine (FGAM) synthase-like enzyme
VTLDWTEKISTAATLFGESQSRAVISLGASNKDAAESLLKKHSLPFTVLGKVGGGNFSVRYNGTSAIACPLAELVPPWSESIAEIMK